MNYFVVPRFSRGFSRPQPSKVRAGRRVAFGGPTASTLGDAAGLTRSPQQEIFEDELPVAANKRCSAGAARYLAIIRFRPCLAFDDLIKGSSAGTGTGMF
jgi:hypothetical protein